MPRFYLPPDQCADPALFLTGREAHHAIRVMRLRRGDSIIQKATELGVFRIVPLLSEHVVVTQLDAKALRQRTDKWRLVAIEAIKQCGSPWLPQIELPVTPKQFLAHHETFELPLIASLQSHSRHPREYFQAFQGKLGRMPRSISIWVG